MQVGLDEDLGGEGGVLAVKDEDPGDSLWVIGAACQCAVVRISEVLLELVAGVGVVGARGARTPSWDMWSCWRKGGRSGGHCEVGLVCGVVGEGEE